MVYPKRVVWKEAPSGHSQTTQRDSQRALVEASLRAAAPREERWDERTRTVHRVRAA